MTGPLLALAALGVGTVAVAVLTVRRAQAVNQLLQEHAHWLSGDHAGPASSFHSGIDR